MKRFAFLPIPVSGTLALLASSFVFSSSSAVSNAGAPQHTSRPGADLAATPTASGTSESLVQRLDVDNDGQDELFIVHPGGGPVLYRNQGSGDWADASAEFGLTNLRAVRSAEWLDVDLDQQPDLFAVDSDGNSRFYRNVAGVLEERGDLAGLSVRGVEEAAWTDFDGDGDPDLVSVSAAGAELRVNDGAGHFSTSQLGERIQPASTPRVAAGASLAAGAEAAPLEGGAPSAGTHVAAKSGASTSTGTSSTSGGSTRRSVSRESRSSGGGEVIEELALAGLGMCVESILDAAGGPCLTASSQPALGSLYPQTLHLNVNDATNRVGVGTVAPTAKLDVEAAPNEPAIRALSPGNFPAGTFITSNPNAFALDVRSLDLAAVFQGDVFFARQGLGAPNHRAAITTDLTGASIFTMLNASGTKTVEVLSAEAAGDGSEIRMHNNSGQNTLRLDADSAKEGAMIALDQSTGTKTVEIMAADDQTPGSEISMFAAAGNRTVHIVSEEGDRNGAQIALGLDDGGDSIILDAQLGTTGAMLEMMDARTVTTVELRAEEKPGEGARLELRKPTGVNMLVLDADTSNGSALAMRNGLNNTTFDVISEEGASNGAQLRMMKGNGTPTVVLDAETTAAAEFGMHTETGQETVEIVSQEAANNGAQMVLRKYDGTATLVMDAERAGLGTEVSMRNSVGQETIQLIAEEVAGDGAQIVLRKSDGTPSIVLDAEQGTSGRITTEVLEITGGADLVEGFATGETVCEAGSVVVIDPERPGQLTLSTEPYDARVAGVVSGAGGIRPGLRMGQAGTMDGDTPVALTGRVLVRCNDENGPIRPGDLLTTSSTAGEAMRASDTTRSFGAVIGKAMGPLEGSEGLVLVLVNLQ